MKVKQLLLLATSVAIFSSCDKDEPIPVEPMEPAVVKRWDIAISPKNENPALLTRNESGNVELALLDNNSLQYNIRVTGLEAGDMLVAAHIHTGDVISNGGVILNFAPTFNAGGIATGLITNLRQSFVDSLKNDAIELYYNVHSMQVPGGLLRGQLNTRLELVADVALSGANEVPAITTTATGTATLRLTSDKKLYVKVNVSNLEAGDALAAAHIHRGAAGANGAVYIGFYANAADFGTTKIISVDDAQIAVLKNDALYFNAHSTNRPSGIIRGQIR